MPHQLGGGGFHNFGVILLALLVLGLGFGVTRLRRGRHVRTARRHVDPAGTAAGAVLAVLAVRAARRDGYLAGPYASRYRLARAPGRRMGGPDPWPDQAVRGQRGGRRRGAAASRAGPRSATWGPTAPDKTTLIRTLLGLTRADAGTMSLLGFPVPAERKQALAAIGAIVDEPRFHPHLTGRDNLRLLAAARGGDASRRIDPSLERVGLTARAGDKVASYSMGMRQRLGVASCLLGDPELLILDEPMNGLDPAGMHEMRTMIASLAGEGRTVVLSSHLLDEVERTCDAVAIVDRGRIVRQGPIDELIRGAGAMVVQVDCAEPARAAQLIDQAGIAGTVLVDAGPADAGLIVTLPAGASRELIADIIRRLVGADISIYGLREIQTSLEDWFLSVTSRLGETS